VKLRPHVRLRDRETERGSERQPNETMSLPPALYSMGRWKPTLTDGSRRSSFWNRRGFEEQVRSGAREGTPLVMGQRSRLGS